MANKPSAIDNLREWQQQMNLLIKKQVDIRLEFSLVIGEAILDLSAQLDTLQQQMNTLRPNVAEVKEQLQALQQSEVKQDNDFGTAVGNLQTAFYELKAKLPIDETKVPEGALPIVAKCLTCGKCFTAEQASTKEFDQHYPCRSYPTSSVPEGATHTPGFNDRPPQNLAQQADIKAGFIDALPEALRKLGKQPGTSREVTSEDANQFLTDLHQIQDEIDARDNPTAPPPEPKLEDVVRWMQKDLHDIKARTDQVIKQFSRNEREWSKLFNTQKSTINSTLGIVMKALCICHSNTLNPECPMHRSKPLPYDYKPTTPPPREPSLTELGGRMHAGNPTAPPIKPITIDPAIMGGKPCFTGSRMPVEQVGVQLQRGGLDELLEDYPYLFNDKRPGIPAATTPSAPPAVDEAIMLLKCAVSLIENGGYTIDVRGLNTDQLKAAIAILSKHNKHE